MQLAARANRLLTRRFPAKTAPAAFERPMASITFDDFPKSAWTVGGPVLEAHGVRATYYAAGGFCGRTVDGCDYYDEADLAAVAAAGHEVACHSFSHVWTQSVSSPELLADLERNAGFLKDRLGAPSRHFAYPYGEASPRTKKLCAERYATARGIHSGVNAGRVDLAQLRAVPLEQRTPSLRIIERWAREARARNGWLILFTHDVGEAPSPYGCTPGELDRAIATLKEAGLEIAPVGEAASAGRLSPH